MRGRLFGLAVGLMLLAEGYALWRPQALGALPHPDLGPFSQYRLVISLLSAAAGAIVILAALFRDTGKAAAPATIASRSDMPLQLELGAPERAQPASPLSLDLEPEPSELVRPPAQPPMPPPAPIILPAAAPMAVEDIDELDPFPGTHAAQTPVAAPIAVAATETTLALVEPPPAPAMPAPLGDHSQFLALTDDGHHLRSAGRLDDALERYSDALGVARRRAAANPGDPAAKRDLAAALTNVGELYDREGRLDSAISMHEESLGVRKTLADQSPEDPGAMRALSTGLERLADARDARGHRSRARDLFRLRLQLAERLSAQAPGDQELAAAVAVTRHRLDELDEALAV